MNTTEQKFQVSFIDAERNKVNVEIEITYRNGYKELTMSGDYGSGGGQIVDQIEPANDAQKELIALWNEYHLNGRTEDLPEDIKEQIEGIIERIEDAEEERKGEPLTNLSDKDLCTLIEEQTTFSDERDIELCAALVHMFELSENDLQDIEIDNNRVTVQGTDYIAGNDSEMDDEWNDELDNYLNDCLLPELKNDTLSKYFDREAWKNDARHDGRGHALNRYDGGEESHIINGTEYFAYQQ